MLGVVTSIEPIFDYAISFVLLADLSTNFFPHSGEPIGLGNVK